MVTVNNSVYNCIVFIIDHYFLVSIDWNIVYLKHDVSIFYTTIVYVMNPDS